MPAAVGTGGGRGGGAAAGRCPPEGGAVEPIMGGGVGTENCEKEGAGVCVNVPDSGGRGAWMPAPGGIAKGVIASGSTTPWSKAILPSRRQRGMPVRHTTVPDVIRPARTSF